MSSAIIVLHVGLRPPLVHGGLTLLHGVCGEHADSSHDKTGKSHGRVQQSAKRLKRE